MIKKGFLGLLKFLFSHLLFRVKYVNLENMNKIEKGVVCPNHSCIFDPFWVYFKVENMWIMAKAELFKNKLLAKIYKAYNVFPIKRGQKDASSLLHSINVIEENDKAKLLIFPEGTRIKKDKERGRAKVGPVFIASKANVPIIPVHITKNPKLFSRVTVVFGEPIDVPNNIHEDKKEMQNYSDMLLDKIYELKNLENKK
ncbi:MAG: lysophospholipid acyltransferase family protein [Clostridia bacterium]